MASKSKTEPTLPEVLVDIWSPLLRDLSANHPLLPTVLTSTIAESLSHYDGKHLEDEAQGVHASYGLCLAAWCAWCVHHLDSVGEEGPHVKKEDVVSILLATQGPDGNSRTDKRYMFIIGWSNSLRSHFQPIVSLPF